MDSDRHKMKMRGKKERTKKKKERKERKEKRKNFSLHTVNAKLTLNSLVHAVGIVIVSYVDVHGRGFRQ